MNRSFLNVLLMIAPLVPAGTLVYTRSLSQAAAPAVADATRELIDQPSTWVPFSAQLERMTGGGEQLAGRYYQGKDGSTRYETGPGLGPTEITAVGIKNMKLGRFYKFSRRVGWTDQPMQLPPGGWH